MPIPLLNISYTWNILIFIWDDYDEIILLTYLWFIMLIFILRNICVQWNIQVYKEQINFCPEWQWFKFPLNQSHLTFSLKNEKKYLTNKIAPPIVKNISGVKRYLKYYEMIYLFKKITYFVDFWDFLLFDRITKYSNIKIIVTNMNVQSGDNIFRWKVRTERCTHCSNCIL